MVFTEFGNLKEVIVGKELKLPTRQMDFTIKNMYNDNFKLSTVYNDIFENYTLDKYMIETRNDQLDNLAKTLTDLDIIVHRPDDVKKLELIRTPDYTSAMSSASNVRDIIFTYGDIIMETPLLVHNRLFENTTMTHIFKEHPSTWIKAPYSKLTEETLDLESWENDRDFSNIPDIFEMGLDGANMIKIGRDIICNVATHNQYLGYKWVKKILTRFYPELEIHMVKVADSHIDGTLLPLAPGTFLANNVFLNKNTIKEQLPQKFKSWDIIYTNDYYQKDEAYWSELSNCDIKLASTRGMDTNVLSIDHKRVLVLDEAVKTMDLLDKKGFEPIPIKLDHGEIFAGGLHCSTLDLRRDDEFIDYTK